jgi:hypothetical protein
MPDAAYALVERVQQYGDLFSGASDWHAGAVNVGLALVVFCVPDGWSEVDQTAPNLPAVMGFPTSEG